LFIGVDSKGFRKGSSDGATSMTTSWLSGTMRILLRIGAQRWHYKREKRGHGFNGHAYILANLERAKCYSFSTP
jgi:hypothetical protein